MATSFGEQLRCTQHNDYFILFCATCKLAVCSVCVVEDHCTHDLQSYEPSRSDFDPDRSANLEVDLDRLQERFKGIKEMKLKCRAMHESVEESYDMRVFSIERDKARIQIEKRAIQQSIQSIQEYLEKDENTCYALQHSVNSNLLGEDRERLVSQLETHVRSNLPRVQTFQQIQSRVQKFGSGYRSSTDHLGDELSFLAAGSSSVNTFRSSQATPSDLPEAFGSRARARDRSSDRDRARTRDRDRDREKEDAQPSQSQGATCSFSPEDPDRGIQAHASTSQAQRGEICGIGRTEGEESHVKFQIGDEEGMTDLIEEEGSLAGDDGDSVTMDNQEATGAKASPPSDPACLIPHIVSHPNPDLLLYELAERIPPSELTPVGLQLNVPNHTISIICANNPKDVAQATYQVLQKWKAALSGEFPQRDHVLRLVAVFRSRELPEVADFLLKKVSPDTTHKDATHEGTTEPSDADEP